jgi:hypothetical protein
VALIGVPRRDIFLTGPFLHRKRTKKRVLLLTLLSSRIRKGERSDAVTIDKRLERDNNKLIRKEEEEKFDTHQILHLFFFFFIFSNNKTMI